ARARVAVRAAAAGTGVGPPVIVSVALTSVVLVWPVAVTPYWPGVRLGTLKVTVALPRVSAVPVPTTGPLKLSWTVSPGRIPVTLTVRDVPGAACGGSNARVAPPSLTVNVLAAVMPLVWPLAPTTYWPGGTFGTVKLRLKVPPSFT